MRVRRLCNAQSIDACGCQELPSELDPVPARISPFASCVKSALTANTHFKDPDPSRERSSQPVLGSEQITLKDTSLLS